MINFTQAVPMSSFTITIAHPIQDYTHPDVKIQPTYGTVTLGYQTISSVNTNFYLLHSTVIMSSVSTIAARIFQCAKMPSEAFSVFPAVVLVPVYQGCKHSLFLSPISVPCFLRCSWMCSWDDETNSWSSVGMCISACRGNSPSWMFLFKVNIKPFVHWFSFSTIL